MCFGCLSYCRTFLLHFTGKRWTIYFFGLELDGGLPDVCHLYCFFMIFFVTSVYFLYSNCRVLFKPTPLFTLKVVFFFPPCSQDLGINFCVLSTVKGKVSKIRQTFPISTHAKNSSCLTFVGGHTPAHMLSLLAWPSISVYSAVQLKIRAFRIFKDLYLNRFYR